MRLVTRAEWGARAPKNRVTGQLTGSSTGHWNGDAIKVSGALTWDHSKCASLVRGIQNFHMDGRKWSDIAYNFIPCPHGYTFEGRGLNVVNGANGTNAANRSSHAIMCIAGIGNPFPDAEKKEFRECVKYIDTHTNAPDKCIGHRDHKATACPGDERYNWIHAGMPVNTTTPTPTPTPTPPTLPSSKEKDGLMEAALILLKMHYDNARGDGTGSYDVRVSDPAGYQAWLNVFLDAYDKNQPLKPISDYIGHLLTEEMNGR